MQCSKCGAVLDADTVFCPECGALKESAFADPRMTPAETENTAEASVAEVKDTELPEEEPTKKGRKLWPVVGCIAGIILIAAAFFVFLALRPKPCTSALDTYLAVVYGEDHSKIKQLAPPEHWKYREDHDSPWRKERTRLLLSFYSEKYSMLLKAGADAQASYRITQEVPAEESRMGQMKQWLKGMYGIMPEAVQEGYLLEYDLVFSGSKGERVHTKEQYVLRIDDRWYLVDKNTVGFNVTFHFVVW